MFPGGGQQDLRDGCPRREAVSSVTYGTWSKLQHAELTVTGTLLSALVAPHSYSVAPSCAREKRGPNVLVLENFSLLIPITFQPGCSFLFPENRSAKRRLQKTHPPEGQARLQHGFGWVSPGGDLTVSPLCLHPNKMIKKKVANCQTLHANCLLSSALFFLIR